MNTPNNKNAIFTDPLIAIELLKDIPEGVYLVKVEDGSILYTNENLKKCLDTIRTKCWGKMCPLLMHQQIKHRKKQEI